MSAHPIRIAKPRSTGWLSPAVILPELHAALGFGFLAAMLLFVPGRIQLPFFGALEVVLVYKETVLDPWREGPTQPFLWEGAKDLAWYHVGFAVFALVFVLHAIL